MVDSSLAKRVLGVLCGGILAVAAGNVVLAKEYSPLTDVKLTAKPNTKPPPVGVAAPDAAALSAVSIRHLNAHMSGELALAADERTAIVTETTLEGRTRLAVWDLSKGKLVRFLSTTVGHSTEPYAGKEDEDFGAQVYGTGFGPRQAFSPSGSRFAIEQRTGDVSNVVLVWDVASGKLLSRSDEIFGSRAPLTFATEDFLVFEAPGTPGEAALVRLHAGTGEADLLRPLGSANGTAGFHRMVVGNAGQLFYVSYNSFHSVNVNSKRHTQGEFASLYKRPRYLAAWLNSDGSQLMGCSSDALIDRWDVALNERISSRTLIPSLKGVQQAWAAPAAGLVALRTEDGDVHVYNIESRRRISLIRVPFTQGRLQSVSLDGKRWVFSTDEMALLVFDFQQPLPAGVIDLAPLLSKKPVRASR